MKSLDIFSKTESGLVDSAGMCGTLFLTLHDCTMKDADTLLEKKSISQVACLVAVLHQGTLGELRAAASEVFRGCLSVEISCIPNYTVSTQNDA